MLPYCASLSAGNYVVVGCGALFFVSPGGVPAPRRLTNLLSVSNQNGAPREAANTDMSNPTHFNTQPKKSLGT